MALPVTFATLTGGNQPLSLLDTQFSAVAELGGIPSAAAGQNTVSLTPFSSTPTIAAYTDLAPSFLFAAAQTSNGSVTINVSLVGARNAYKWNGLQQCSAGDLVAGFVYKATFLTALNGGAGGFVVDAIGVNNNVSDIEFQIDGGGSPINTGIKGFLRIPWAATVSSWSVMADQSGSIAIDILRANSAVPTVSMIGAGTKPNLTASQFTAPTAPSGWTSTSLLPNDFIGYSVTSVATVTRVTIDLSLAKL